MQKIIFGWTPISCIRHWATVCFHCVVERSYRLFSSMATFLSVTTTKKMWSISFNRFPLFFFISPAMHLYLWLLNSKSHKVFISQRVKDLPIENRKVPSKLVLKYPIEYLETWSWERVWNDPYGISVVTMASLSEVVCFILMFSQDATQMRSISSRWRS